MVVHGHAHRALRLLLTHDVLRELLIDLVRRGQLGEKGLGEVDVVDFLVGLSLSDNLPTGLHALVADEDAVRGPDELLNLAAGLSAK